MGVDHDPIARARGYRYMASGSDRGADHHPPVPLVIGRKIGATAAEADAQWGASGDHGQLVSERGVISISCIAEPRGSATAYAMASATFAGSWRLLCSGSGMPCSGKRSNQW